MELQKSGADNAMALAKLGLGGDHFAGLTAPISLSLLQFKMKFAATETFRPRFMPLLPSLAYSRYKLGL